MNYHSSQNTTVMSTVFKLKAAILMVCAFVVMCVSTAWGQAVIPVVASSANNSSVTGAVYADSFNGNIWVVRGDDASGNEQNATVNVLFEGTGIVGTTQYALFYANGADGGFINNIATYYEKVMILCITLVRCRVILDMMGILSQVRFSLLKIK